MNRPKYLQCITKLDESVEFLASIERNNNFPTVEQKLSHIMLTIKEMRESLSTFSQMVKHKQMREKKRQET